MRPGIRGQRDFFAGLIFIFFGTVAVFVSREYPMGSAVRMGPGYFPFVLGWLLAILGVIVCLRGLLVNDTPVDRVYWRPLLLILLAVGAFALAVESLGIVIAVALLLSIGAAASPESRPLETVVVVLALLALTLGVFVYGLRLPFQVWPA